jgi:hypothetical protein
MTFRQPKKSGGHTDLTPNNLADNQFSTILMTASRFAQGFNLGYLQYANFQTQHSLAPNNPSQPSSMQHQRQLLDSAI